jgi:hypothetical protein
MTRPFSFFTRGSGGCYKIRAHQIAPHLGARINPLPGDYEEDTCIWVKPKRIRETKYAWLDPMDIEMINVKRFDRVATRNLGVIAASLSAFDMYHEMYHGRKRVFIPQHHCNFEKVMRPDRSVQVAGYAGNVLTVQWPTEDVVKGLGDIGMAWRPLTQLSRREYSARYYPTIDVQIVYRPECWIIPAELRNTLKLANAGAYGIPTVAFPEPAFIREWKDEVLYGESMEEIIAHVKRLKEDTGLYREMSARAYEKSKEYDIEVIARRYVDLLGG